MKFKSHPKPRIMPAFFFKALLVFTVFISSGAFAQSNVTVRVMSANLTSGNLSRYESAGLDIFQGLKPDIVAIQEFKYASTTNGTNTPAAFREMLDNNFGTNFSYFRETNASFAIPNGIISRYPIIASGSWTDSLVSDRSFAWAQIDLPGTNDLYVVSVHLYSSGTATDRNTEATSLQAQIQSNFPANAWVIVAGDFNTTSRSEAAVTTFKTFLSDSPVPTDNAGNANSNEPRNKPYDYVLPSFSLNSYFTPVAIGSQTFINGLVFDSAIYTPLSDVAPVVVGDSHTTNMQHMGVVKDFLIPVSGMVSPNTAPTISHQPQSQAISPGSNTTFSVTASGTAPLTYQWLFNSNNISGATTNLLALNNVQFTNAGNYTVLITNLYGSLTSSVAILAVSNFPPGITTQPQSQAVNPGTSATFSITASGTAPLSYQWLLGGTNIAGAITNTYTRSNVQTNDAGNYSVLVTNFAGSVTSLVATLTVNSTTLLTNQTVIAQWNFNSLTPDTNVATGITIPAVGTGTASLIGGVTATFATGDPTFDPAGSTDNSGWNTATYPAQGTGNKTRGAQFTVSTVGKQNIVITWSSESPGTGSKYGRLQYSTNGADFTDFPAAFTNGSSFNANTNSLAAVSGVNDNASFAFRFMSEFESTAAGTANANYVAGDTTKSYGPTGTMRYDMVTVSGTVIITNSPPAGSARLSTPGLVNGQFAMFITGTAGSNYVVQISTNLTTPNWISLFTNASPFTFTDTNLTLPQKFYRAIVQP